VERLPLRPSSSPRSHVRARYQVQIDEHGRPRQEQILVRGTGLGYFGRQTLAVSEAVGDFLPPVYGFEDGLLYRAWLPDDQAISCAPSDWTADLAETAVAYAVARRQTLPVWEDPGERMLGEWPAWEVASNTLSRVFGRAWMAARIPLVDPIVHHLLRTERPAVIDANMAPDDWFVGEGEGDIDDPDQPIVKVGFDAGIFRGDVELACYDPIFDLASLAASIDVLDGGSERAKRMARLLRAGYERETGERIDEERWLLYQLVRFWDEERDGGPDSRGRLDRARARALQRYYAATYFRGVRAPDAGPTCALDVDGVLETSAHGFPGLTPASALALCALAQHGYRPVLATGRSLGEVRERCHLYPLAGGVAEYGAACYVRATGQVVDLLSPAARADLARLRTVLTNLDGVHLDADYRYAIRAYRLDAKGRRRGLPREIVEAAIGRAGGPDRLRAIYGDDQTDVVPAGVDKATGVRALLAALGEAPGESSLELAVGDTVADLPMLAEARRGLAPAHADAAVRERGVPLTGRPYQAGLAQAVAAQIGHAPGRCLICRPPALTPNARLLLQVLAVPEAGPWGIVQGALRLALTATRLSAGRRAPLHRCMADMYAGS
jgi:hydroxymethylpyrimidine pyrophosphatase-like HAD family hydrolase